MSFGSDALVMAGVEGRSLVHRLLPARVADALTAANAIAHPRYRCQALAEIGETVTDPAQARAILERALTSARAG